jgi:hypothetical protein
LIDPVKKQLRDVGGSYELLKVYVNTRPRSNTGPELMTTIMPIFVMRIGKKVITTVPNGAHRVDEIV